MADRALMIGLLVGGAALLFASNRASASVAPDGAGYPVDSWDDLLDEFAPSVFEPVPSGADYADALPGSELYSDGGEVAPDTTPWGMDDAEQFAPPLLTWNDDMTVSALLNASDSPSALDNLNAFLMAIRWAEGTAGPNGYRTLYGGKLFDSFADHPRLSFKTPWGRTSAAGAYQMQAGTWDDAKRALALPDFTPRNQDRAAVWIIDKKRRALSDVLAGRISQAMYKLRLEWASLPTSPDGQPTKSAEDFVRMFMSQGGALAADDTAFA